MQPRSLIALLVSIALCAGLVVGSTAAAGEVRILTNEDVLSGLLTTSSLTGIPDLWVVRFSKESSGAIVGSGDEKVDQAVGTLHRKAFASTAARFSHVAKFAEFVLDTSESVHIAKSLKVDPSNVPAVYLFGSRLRRPTVRNGGMQYGRVVFPLPQAGLVGADTGDIEKLSKMVRANLPSRYADPVTFEIMDTPTIVFSRKDMHQISKQRAELTIGASSITAAAMIPKYSSLPKKAMLVLLRLTEPGDEEAIALLAAAAAQAGPTMEVFLTEDADFAAVFGIESYRGAVVLNYPLPLDMSYDPKSLVLEMFAAAADASIENLLMRIESAKSSNAVPSALDLLNVNHPQRQVETWKRDVQTLVTSSPLRRLDSTEQFQRDVASPKAAAVLLYFLRETDEHFERDHKSAVQVATAMQENTRQLSQMRTEVFYVDPEVHKDVPRLFNVPSVPAVALLLGLQDGKHGVKFIGKDGTAIGSQQGVKPAFGLPTAEMLFSYVHDNTKLMDTRGMFPLQSEQVRLAPLGEQQQHDLKLAKDAKQRRDRTKAMLKRASGGGAAAASSVNEDDDDEVHQSNLQQSVDNRRSLVTDLRTYPEAEPQENTFIRQIASGTFQFETKKKTDEDSATTSSSSSAASSKKPVSTKQSKKMAAQKQKIQEELEAKRKAKEERMKKKAVEDEAFRAQMATATKQRATEAAKATDGEAAAARHATENPTNSVPPTKDPNVLHVEKPKYASNKPPKNRHAQSVEWAEDKKKMVKERVKVAKDGSVRFADVLEL